MPENFNYSATKRVELPPWGVSLGASSSERIRVGRGDFSSIEILRNAAVLRDADTMIDSFAFGCHAIFCVPRPVSSVSGEILRSPRTKGDAMTTKRQSAPSPTELRQ